MNNKPNTALAPAELRRRAEARLRQQQKERRAGVGGRESNADAQRLLHELQVHQVELEMQNATLQDAHLATEFDQRKVWRLLGQIAAHLIQIVLHQLA